MNMKLNKLTAAIIFGATLLTGAHAMANTHTAQSATAIEVPAQTIQLTQEWDKVFPQSDKVTHRKVTFKNRYGITLAADLYAEKCTRQTARHCGGRPVWRGERAIFRPVCANFGRARLCHTRI